MSADLAQRLPSALEVSNLGRAGAGEGMGLEPCNPGLTPTLTSQLPWAKYLAESVGGSDSKESACCEASILQLKNKYIKKYFL